jgi:site-specific DNA-methyltransferase (adenine-specific)
MNSHALKSITKKLDDFSNEIEEIIANDKEKDSFRNKLFFSSKSNEWETPDNFYNKLDLRFRFTLDAASTEENKKCEKYFTFQDNALEQDWSGNVVFLNPPYGRGIKEWVEKAYKEGKKENTTVVVLIPARTDTQYFHKFCMRAKEVHFVKGRLKFRNVFESIENVPAPFPSMVVVFDGDHDSPEFFAMERP